MQLIMKAVLFLKFDYTNKYLIYFKLYKTLSNLINALKLYQNFTKTFSKLYHYIIHRFISIKSCLISYYYLLEKFAISLESVGFICQKVCQILIYYIIVMLDELSL